MIQTQKHVKTRLYIYDSKLIFAINENTKFCNCVLSTRHICMLWWHSVGSVYLTLYAVCTVHYTINLYVGTIFTTRSRVRTALVVIRTTPVLRSAYLPIALPRAARSSRLRLSRSVRRTPSTRRPADRVRLNRLERLAPIRLVLRAVPRLSVPKTCELHRSALAGCTRRFFSADSVCVFSPSVPHYVLMWHFILLLCSSFRLPRHGRITYTSLNSTDVYSIYCTPHSTSL